MKKISDFFDVVFENENFLAINKSTNLSTQKNDFYEDSVEEILENIGKPYSLLERSGIVHRIDRNTTGLLLIAKSHSYREKLLEIFKEKKIKKFYLSLNLGQTHVKNGVVKMFLKKDFSRGKKVRMRIGKSSDKLVEISFEKVSEVKDLTLLKVQALTGKTHQIRLALESIKLPIYNDELYKTGVSNDFEFNSDGHYLHSYMLEFFDGEKKFKLFAKIPSYFSYVINSKKMLIDDKEILLII